MRERVREFLNGDGVTIPKTGLRVDPTLTLGNLLNTVAIVLFLAPIMWVALGYASRTDETQKRLTELQGSVKDEFSSLRRETGDNLKILQLQIANLPSQAARLDQAERSIGELRQGLRETNDRVGVVEGRSIENREAIKRLDRLDAPVRQTR